MRMFETVATTVLIAFFLPDVTRRVRVCWPSGRSTVVAQVFFFSARSAVVVDAPSGPVIVQV
ncbi:unannotated protein [freshwater metagenome]|uniref:Unannotated protein n=1 Tax=freshwater metagenome TaxID=449393 RepID=A0A6J7EQ98_9ZZZZ